MSASIVIRPEGSSGKKLSLADVLPEELCYGIPDAFDRLEEGKEGEYTLLFDPENIGRGIQLRLDGTTAELRLNYPNSRHDIGLCYLLAERICRMQGAGSFEYEGETVPLGRIEQIVQRDVDMTAYALRVYGDKIRSGESKTLITFGAINPLYIGEKEIALFGDDIDKFGAWLNERQQMDVYYAAPHFYEKKDGSTFGAFALRADVHSVLPVEPSVPVSMHGQFEVSEWVVMLGYGDGRQSEGLSVIHYEGLAEHLQKGEYYDANHRIVRLTDSDVEALLRTHRATL